MHHRSGILIVPNKGRRLELLFQYLFRAFKRNEETPLDETWRREEVAGGKSFRRMDGNSSEQMGSRKSHSPQAENAKPKFIRFRSRKALAVGAAALGVGGAGYFALSDVAEVPSRLARVPAMDTTPGGQRQRESERYRETLQTANEMNAANADRARNSFIPIPEDLTESINPPLKIGAAPWENRELDVLDQIPPQVPNELNADPDSEKVDETDPIEAATDAPDPPVMPISNGDKSEALRSDIVTDSVENRIPDPTINGPSFQEPAGRSNGPSKADNPYRAAIIGQMNAIARGLAVRPPKGEILIANGQYSSNARSNGRLDSNAQVGNETRLDDNISGGRSANQIDNENSAGGVRISAGSILYGETLNAADSDNPAPIVVEISQGPNEGLRLIGSGTASAYGDGFAIEFDTLVNLEGSTQPVSAIGLDGFDGDVAVASSKDLRIFERYGPLFASSFIEGFARSAARTGSTTVVANGSTTVAIEKPTGKEHLYSALGEAGGRLATDLAANAPKGPKVMLEAGHPIGVLFVETVTIDSPARR